MIVTLTLTSLNAVSRSRVKSSAYQSGGEPFKDCWAIPEGFKKMDETTERRMLQK